MRQTRSGSSAAGASCRDGAALSGRGRNGAEGDDLHRARQFCRCAGEQMQAIIAADRPVHPPLLTRKSAAALPQGRDPEWLCDRLGTIQREAKRARARAVYRSAQDALQLIQRCSNHMPIDWRRVDGRLFALNKLLGQYESGLSDLEGQLSEVDADAAEGCDADPAAMDDTRIFDPVDQIARQTLSDLLPHASDAERDALTRLMDVDLTPDLSEPEPERKDLAAECLEWIMPDLVQDLLTQGREFGKIFSVSHSVEAVMIAPGTADAVKRRIRDSLSALIAGSLPLQGIGRIDLGETADGLRISGSGFDAFDLALPERVAAERGAPQLDELAKTLSEETAPPPRRLITDATEADLRAQLAALMDGGLPESGPS